VQSDWKDAAARYAERRSYSPEKLALLETIEKLCLWISAEEYSNFLFWETSMHDLSIFQIQLKYEDRLLAQHLRVSPIFEQNKIEFRFIDTHDRDRQWVRTEPANFEAVKRRFAGFLNQVGWC